MKRKIKEYGFVLVGSFLAAWGLNMFLVPFQLSSGGIGTLGVILLYFFKIPLSVTNLIANIVLFALGVKLLPRESLFKTIWGILFFTAFLEITSYLPQIKEDVFLAMVIGGVLDGVGMGLVLKVNGSTGGIDFCSLMVNRKFPHISVGRVIFVVNLVLFILSGIAFKSFAVAFYSIIAIFISTKVTDAVVNVGEEAKAIEIISDKAEMIKQIILKGFNRGLTEIYTKGAYTQEERNMLLCVVRPKEVATVVEIVKSVDDKAFMVIYDAHKVLGEGFEAL